MFSVLAHICRQSVSNSRSGKYVKLITILISAAVSCLTAQGRATVYSYITAITATLYILINSKCQAADYTGRKAVTTNLWITSDWLCSIYKNSKARLFTYMHLRAASFITGTQFYVWDVSLNECPKYKSKKKVCRSNNGLRAETWWSWVSPFRQVRRLWAVRS